MTVSTLRKDARDAEKYGEWSSAAAKWRTVATSTTDRTERDLAEQQATKCERRAVGVPAL
jgi:hypothetical protein